MTARIIYTREDRKSAARVLQVQCKMSSGIADEMRNRKTELVTCRPFESSRSDYLPREPFSTRHKYTRACILQNAQSTL